LSDLQTKHSFLIRRVQRYQRGNHNPYIEEQTRQWPKEKVQKGNNDLQNIHIKLKIVDIKFSAHDAFLE